MFITDMQNQFTLERQNEQFYRALAAAAENENWPGAAKFFEQSADDEQSHALRVRNYLIDRNAVPVFQALEAVPEIDAYDYLGMFKLALERENITTASLKEKYQNAVNEPDPQTVSKLIVSDGDWPGFLEEQTISERELIDYITTITGLDKPGILTFDQTLLKE